MKELSDLEICKRIGELEDIKVSSYRSTNQLGETVDKWFYNPLKDDALCFQLMVKYKVLISWNPHINNNCTAVIDGTSDDIPFPFAIADNNDESPNKAICLSIIEAHSA